MFVICRLLFGLLVCCLLVCDDCSLLGVVRCFVCCLMLVVCLLFVVYCLFVVCCWLFVVRCVLHDVCCLWFEVVCRFVVLLL